MIWCEFVRFLREKKERDEKKGKRRRNQKRDASNSPNVFLRVKALSCEFLHR